MHLEQGYTILDCKGDFKWGWLTIHAEDWKPGIMRVHQRTQFGPPWEFRMAFCSVELFQAAKNDNLTAINRS